MLISDPDYVFRRPIEREASPGSPIAQRWLEYRRQAETQGFTWPALVHTSDLARLLPNWIRLTKAIFQATNRWESDMFALVSAAATIGMRFELATLGAFIGWPDNEVEDAPIVHYCQEVLARDGRPLWYKRAYTPWEKLDGVGEAEFSYCNDLLRIVNEFGDLKS